MYKIPDQPIGCAIIQVPEFLKNNKAIVTLEKNLQTGEPLHDNLCLFRCLALFRGSNPKSLEKKPTGCTVFTHTARIREASTGYG